MREFETGHPSFGHLTRRPVLLQKQSLERDPQPQSDGAAAINTFLAISIDQAPEVGIRFKISNDRFERRYRIHTYIEVSHIRE